MKTFARISKKVAGFLRNESGTAITEFALMLPILLLLFAMTIEGGRMMWSYQTASAGVRDATRYLARVAPADICSTSGSVAGYASDLENIVATAISGTLIFPGGVTINSVNPSLICITGSYRGSPVAVTRVSASITIDFPFGALFGFGGGTARTGFTTTLIDENRIYGT